MNIKDFKEKLEKLLDENVISKEEKSNIEYDCALVQANKSAKLEQFLDKVIYKLTHKCL
jgi:hypothetical protein